MTRQIDYRSRSPYPADEVYATMVDPDYLRARLVVIGGPGAGLLDHHTDAEGARYRLRHGLDAKDLPAAVRRMLPGDLVVERAESWTRHDGGRYAGKVQVTIPGTPARAAGGMRLHDAEPGGSELLVRADVTVKVPFIGGRIETIVAQQVTNLLASERDFMLTWLTNGR